MKGTSMRMRRFRSGATLGNAPLHNKSGGGASKSLARRREREKCGTRERKREWERERGGAVPWKPIWAMDLPESPSTAHKPPNRGLWCWHLAPRLTLLRRAGASFGRPASCPPKPSSPAFYSGCYNKIQKPTWPKVSGVFSQGPWHV